MPATVPLVLSAHLSEFGDLTETEAFNARAGQDRDLSYVPGFSDMKRARELKVTEMRAGKATMADVRALDLPVNLRWGRNQSKKGEPDNTKVFGHGRNGYRTVTKADVGQPWLKEMPLGAQVQADGSIRNGDTILMVCDAKNAAINVQRKAHDTEARLTGSLNAFEQNLRGAEVNGVRINVAASEPTVTKTTAKAEGRSTTKST